MGKTQALKIEDIVEENPIKEVEKTIIEEYQQLNDKCDTVISKIKKRKNKK